MYAAKSQAELLELLHIERKLTFSSKLLLLKELDKRGMLDESNLLHQSIDKYVSEIEDLAYLKNIGFKADREGNGLKITRTFWAILIDVIAVLLGVVFCFVGLMGVGALINSFTDESAMNMGIFASIAVELVLGYFGIKFLSGFDRLVNLSNFELTSTGGLVRLKRRFDYKTKVIEEKAENLKMSISGDTMKMFLGESEIMSANAKSIVQKMTIEALIRKLK